MMRPLFIILLLLWLAPVLAQAEPVKLVVGSKKFTESVILGEMIRQLAAADGQPMRHQRELGGTRLLWNALLAGEIDLYPEYNGTLIQEILLAENIRTRSQLEQALRKHGLRATPSLGFNNTYAIGVMPALAQRLGLKRISDLRKYPELVLGFGSEFMQRADGWPGLQQRYQLPQQNVRGLDHDLAYRGLVSGSLQAMELFTTDAEIDYYGLQVLQDDLHYFPQYNAVILYRSELAQRAPKLVVRLHDLAGRIDAASMAKMNAKVKIDQQSESQVAGEFLHTHLGLSIVARQQSPWQKIWQRVWQHSREHLMLVALSLSLALLVSIPLGIAAARYPRIGHVILAVVGIIQTIPSLAIFVFLIPLLGIGGPPAVVALFLYSLLPIVRNTHAGLTSISPAIRESAQVLGLSTMQRLRLIELPLSAATILAGIKTSAVINIGTATLAALIGAGGYGQPILTGIRLDDTSLILQGAIPSAVLALLVQGLFELAERRVVPRGLRLG